MDTLLPAYIEHCRLLGKPNPTKNINSRLLYAKKQQKKIPVLLQKASYNK